MIGSFIDSINKQQNANKYKLHIRQYDKLPRCIFLVLVLYFILFLSCHGYIWEAGTG